MEGGDTLATFQNLATGNILRTNNPETIRLMRKSEQYKEIDTHSEKPGEEKK